MCTIRVGTFEGKNCTNKFLGIKICFVGQVTQKNFYELKFSASSKFWKHTVTPWSEAYLAIKLLHRWYVLYGLCFLLIDCAPLWYSTSWASLFTSALEIIALEDQAVHIHWLAWSSAGKTCSSFILMCHFHARIDYAAILFFSDLISHCVKRLAKFILLG